MAEGSGGAKRGAGEGTARWGKLTTNQQPTHNKMGPIDGPYLERNPHLLADC
jgi:hypothetical protein